MKLIAIVPYGLEQKFVIGNDITIVSSRFASKNVFSRWVWTMGILPSLLRSWGADLLFCPGGIISAFGRWRTVVTFQNMLPFSPKERRRFPFGYIRLRLWLLRFLQKASFRRTDLLIFISEYAKAIIQEELGGALKSHVVIRHGIGEHFFRFGSQRPLAFPCTPYVAYVSILDHYKAQLEVVIAWSMLLGRSRPKEKLILVGPENPTYARRVRALISKLNLEEEILIVKGVSYEDLPWVYQNATLNIFASSCENCPTILMEALAAGRPIVCSSYEPMPEIAGDAVSYFDPYRPEQLASLLDDILGDMELQNVMGKRAAERAVCFDIRKSAESTWESLLQVLKN